MAKKNRIRKKRNDENVLRSFAGSIDEAFSEDLSEISEEDVIVVDVPEKARSKKTGRIAMFIVGVAVLVFAVVGIVTTITGTVGIIGNIANNTGLKNEFQLFLYPAVATDIPTFEQSDTLANTTIIKTAITKIQLTGDMSKYQSDTGVLYIPEFDVETNAKSIFGGSITIEHQTVGFGADLATYDAEKKSYAVADFDRIPNYYPEILNLSSVGETFTVEVGYYPPTVQIAGLDKEPQLMKIMKYTVVKSGDKKTITSVVRSESMEGGGVGDI